jgi:hypothetical protein
MADDRANRGSSATLGFLLGAALVALGVLGYLYYEHTHKQVIKIDVPGFSGEIKKD